MKTRIALILALAACMSSCNREKLSKPMAVLSETVRAEVEIEPYRNQWLDIFKKNIKVDPHTWYELSGEAMSSLPTLKSSVFLGARFKWGDVLKDKEFLLFHDKMTPMKLRLYTYNQTEITIFCGSWVNRTVSFELGNIALRKVTEPTYRATTDYNEPYRPEYHFTPRLGWMNDPNGLYYKDGEYHLCYQHNPHSPNNYTMHWGHAVSKDLIHWKHLPIAIYPDSLGSIFSGSAVVDDNNTAGFGKGAIVAMYTSDGRIQQQCLAYSTNGRTFKKYNDGQPVLSIEGHPDFRDPKVGWCDETEEWVAVMTGGQEVLFYGSKDLKNWHYLSSFGKGYGSHAGTWECPDLISLKVEGTDIEKSVLIVNIDRNAPFGGSATQYFVGEFDGTNFIPDEPCVTKWMDYGKDHYACVTWGQLPNDRKLAIAWMSNWQYARNTPTIDFRGAMTMPRDLSLYRKDSDLLMRCTPAPELLSIFNKEQSEVSARNRGVFEAVIDIESKNSGLESVILENSLGEKAVILLDYSKRLLSFDRTSSGKVKFHPDFKAVTSCPLPEGPINLKVFSDHSSIEIFVNDGEYCMTNLVFPNEPFDTIKYESENPDGYRLTVYGIK